jgi:hypothetical protein
MFRGLWEAWFHRGRILGQKIRERCLPKNLDACFSARSEDARESWGSQPFSQCQSAVIVA